MDAGWSPEAFEVCRIAGDDEESRGEVVRDERNEVAQILRIDLPIRRF